MANEASMVRLHNAGSRPFRGQYAGAWYDCPPGADLYVPYYGAIYWCGNPNAVNVGEDRGDQHRHHEVERLNVQYGLQNDLWFAESGTPIGDVDPRLDHIVYVDGRHPNLPDLEVYDLTTGEQFQMVLNDPEGAAVTAASPVLKDQRAMENEIARMAETQRVLIAELTKTNPELAKRLSPAADLPTSLDPSGTTPVLEEVDDPEPAEVEATEDTPPGRAPHTKAASV